MFCRQNTTDKLCRFRHFFIYCLHDGSRLNSMAAVVKHRNDHHKHQKRRVAMYCGECGRIYRSMASLSIHVCQKRFHRRRSTIVGYDKHSFNPCADVPPLSEMQSLTTPSDVATTSLCSISPASGLRLTSAASVSTSMSKQRGHARDLPLQQLSQDIASDGIVSGYASKVSVTLILKPVTQLPNLISLVAHCNIYHTCIIYFGYVLAFRPTDKLGMNAGSSIVLLTNTINIYLIKVKCK